MKYRMRQTSAMLCKFVSIGNINTPGTLRVIGR
jgi:hypothetical protein